MPKPENVAPPVTLQDYLESMQGSVWTLPDTEYVLNHVKAVEETYRAMITEIRKKIADVQREMATL